MAVLAIGHLAACATGAPDTRPTTPDGAAQFVASVDGAPLEVAPVIAPPAAPILAPPAREPEAAEPIIIRGNDRVIGAPRTAPAIKGPASSYKFEDAPSAEVVNVMLRDILKVDYVVYPPLPGTITLATRGPITADRALLLLENALQVNGIVMARDARGVYHVGKPEALRGIVAAPQVVGHGPLAPGYGAVIYPLQYLGANEMASILRPMVPADAIVRVDTTRNMIVMQGTRAQADGWTELVNTFDVNILRGMSVGVFPLKHSSAAEVDSALRLMVGSAGGAAPVGAAASPAGSRAAAGSSGANSAAASAPPDSASPLYGALRIMPIDRINAVMVITPRAAYLDEVRYWIEQFDRPNMNSAEPQLFVYKIQNGSATHLAELLNGIYGGGVAQQPGATGANGIAPGLAGAMGATQGGLFGGSASGGTLAGGSGGFGTGTGSGMGGAMGSRFGAGVGSMLGMGSGFGSNIGGLVGAAGLNQQRQPQQGPNVVTTTLGQSVRVMADRINNTLLIHATPAEYQRIESTLKRLDIQRAQVLIEATIIEVTLGDGLQYGLQWAFNNGVAGNRGGAGVLNNSTTALTPGADGRFSLAGAAAQGFTYAISNGAGNITALLSALANKSLIKVISSPSLLVLDNHTATMAVGNQQPINIGTTILTTGNVATTNNIQYKDTGVMLGVTPSVSAGDLVTLDINQAVTDVGPTDPVTGQVTFLQRQLNSQVAVRSGETLALGGLIKDNTSRSTSGLPILSSIPVIGGLFGTQNKNNSRTELLVVFTPRVVRSDDDARAISRELRDRMRGLTATRPESLQ